MSENDPISVVPYDPEWPLAFRREVSLLQTFVVPFFERIEHMGSTAVPGLAAKPVIDMMAGVPDLDSKESLGAQLAPLGYAFVETGMTGRWLFRRKDAGVGYHLHVVDLASMERRKELLFRDYLRENHDALQAYAALKQGLATEFASDRLAYTKAKTAFVQQVIDAVHDARGWPRIDVWED